MPHLHHSQQQHRSVLSSNRSTCSPRSLLHWLLILIICTCKRGCFHVSACSVKISYYAAKVKGGTTLDSTCWLLHNQTYISDECNTDTYPNYCIHMKGSNSQSHTSLQAWPVVDVELHNRFGGTVGMGLAAKARRSSPNFQPYNPPDRGTISLFTLSAWLTPENESRCLYNPTTSFFVHSEDVFVDMASCTIVTDFESASLESSSSRRLVNNYAVAASFLLAVVLLHLA